MQRREEEYRSQSYFPTYLNHWYLSCSGSRSGSASNSRFRIPFFLIFHTPKPRWRMNLVSSRLFHVKRMGTNGRTGRNRYRKRNSKCTEKAGFAVYDPESITLLKWAKQNGIFFGKLCPAMFTQTGRGLMTSKKLIHGDKVISVPGNMLITLKTANESKIGIQLSKLQTKHLLSTKQMLCVFLLYEKYRGRSSFWYPYIATLPKSFNTPAYFSEEEIKLLPCDLQNECCVQLMSVKESYKRLKGCLEGQSSDCHLDKKFINFVTFDEFMWAWFVINTRSVYKAVSKNTVCKNRMHSDDAYALAPVLDLLNHTDDAEVNNYYILLIDWVIIFISK